MIKDPNQVEDVIQETWLEILKSLPGFEGKSKITTWIYTISKRVIFKHLKQEKKHNWKSYASYMDRLIPSTNYPPDKDLEDLLKFNCSTCITGMLHCLKPNHHLIYILREIFKLPFKEISLIIDKKEATIRKFSSRASIKINNFISKQCILFNLEGNCNCGMKQFIKGSNFQKKLNQTIVSIENIYQQYESSLQKN